MTYREVHGTKMGEVISGIAIYLTLLKLYAGKKLNCGACPHKGIKDRVGNQCLGHGLRFDENGVVLGKFDECYLQIPGTLNMSKPGIYNEMDIVEKCYARQIDLMWNGILLASNPLDRISMEEGDILKTGFSINGGAVVI